MNLRAAQRRAELLMTSVCEVRAPGSGWVFDPTTEQDEPAPGPLVYEGIVRVRPAREARNLQAGAQDISTQQYEVTVPLAALGIEVGHTLTVTVSGDPYLVGRPLTVTAVSGQSIGYQRRLTALDNLG